ncbi:MAG TPA: class I SAM-dependent methyltransferase [Bryobacteraceae bacterium]|nr:class I SAM-dependent methyltransferase [Bryobacteraceae bacterium]
MPWGRWFGRRRGTAAPLAEIRECFEAAAADEAHFPSSIDPRIYHVRFMLDFFGDLNGKRVLDIGCGKGRFARIVREQNPRAEVVALDLAESMLRCVPAGIARVSASMTSLPLRSASCDAAYATESLEHAVDVDTAVAEMCRVVRPGGRILVIDKNAEQWGRLNTPRWERWFTRHELEKLLRRHCRQADSRFISYWEDVEPDGLFIAWTAMK